jgi:transposase-like protein
MKHYSETNPKKRLRQGCLSFALCFPHLVQYYVLDDNVKPVFDVGSRSLVKCSWLCPVCGMTFTRTPNHIFVSQRKGLPFQCNSCFRNKGRAMSILDYPELAAEYDVVKNGVTDLRLVKVGYKESRKRVWWKCVTCGKSWLVSISSRVKGAGRCKICFPRKQADAFSKKRIQEFSFGKRYPEYLEYWSADNTLEPYSVYWRDRHFAIKWLCKECGKTWEGTVNTFVHRVHHSCKQCGYEIGKQNQFKTVQSIKKLHGSQTKKKLTDAQVLSLKKSMVFVKFIKTQGCEATKLRDAAKPQTNGGASNMLTINKLKRELFDSLVGKKIYLMLNNRPASGVIRDCDASGLIVDCGSCPTRLGLDEPFFDTEDELFTFLKEALRDLKEMDY